MGMYTCLFGKIKFKDDVAELVRRKNKIGGRHSDSWIIWTEVLNTRRIRKHPDVITFLGDYRTNSIPYCSSAYFDVSSYSEYGHLLSEFDENAEYGCYYCCKTKELTFFCSLKDYTDTIEKFLHILPLIADDWDLYSQTEDSYLYGHKPRRYRPTGFSLNVLLSQKDESGLHTPPVHDDPLFPMYIAFAEKGSENNT